MSNLDKGSKPAKSLRRFTWVTTDDFLLHVVTKARGLDCYCPACERERVGP